MPTKIEITHKTILFTLGVLILGWFLLAIKEIILLLFLAFILMSSLRPLVEGLEKLKIPRLFSILLIYLALIIFLIIFGGAIIPGLVLQTVHFWEKLPEIINKILPFLPLNFEFISQQITPISGNLLRVTLDFFSNIFTVLTLMVLTFYLLMERKNLEESFKSFFGEERGGKILKITWKIEEKLGGWMRGQLFLMLIIAVASFVGLIILKVDYALPLAITAGFLEIVPFAGPIISAIPAILVALTNSPVLALAVIVLYLIIQQLENHLIVPGIIKKTVGLPPVITLVALMIGGKLAGISGALLAVPMVVVLQVILSEISSSSSS